MGGSHEPSLGPRCWPDPDLSLDLMALLSRHLRLPALGPSSPTGQFFPSSSPPPSCFLFLAIGIRHLLPGSSWSQLQVGPTGQDFTSSGPQHGSCAPGPLPCLTLTSLFPVQSPGGGEQVAIDPSESGKCYGDGHDPRKVAQQLLPEGLGGHRREGAREAGWRPGRSQDQAGPHSPLPLR